MGKRPYYVITQTNEGDGYNADTIYIGTNFKAAVARFRYIFEKIRDNDFGDVDRDRLEASFPDIPNEFPNGRSIWASINDNDCYYTSLELSMLNTDTFKNRNLEDMYKRDNPEAKH